MWSLFIWINHTSSFGVGMIKLWRFLSGNGGGIGNCLPLGMAFTNISPILMFERTGFEKPGAMAENITNDISRIATNLPILSLSFEIKHMKKIASSKAMYTWWRINNIEKCQRKKN